MFNLSLIAPAAVKPSEIAAGEVRLPGTRVTIIFSSARVSDSTSERGSVSRIMQLCSLRAVYMGQYSHTAMQGAGSPLIKLGNMWKDQVGGGGYGCERLLSLGVLLSKPARRVREAALNGCVQYQTTVFTHIYASEDW